MDSLFTQGTRGVATQQFNKPEAIPASRVPEFPRIHSITHFELKETSPDNAVLEFQDTYTQSHEYDFEVDNYKIRGVKYLPSLQVNFNANIFTKDGKLILELNRESGCVIAFNDMYQDMKSKLSSVQVQSSSSFPSLELSDEGITDAVKIQFVASTLSSLLMMAKSEPKMAIQAFQSLNSLFSTESLDTFKSVVNSNQDVLGYFSDAFESGLQSDYIEIRTWALTALATAIKKGDSVQSLYHLLNVAPLVRRITETTATTFTIIPDSHNLASKEFNRSYIAVILALSTVAAIPDKQSVDLKLGEYQRSIGNSGRSVSLITDLNSYFKIAA